MRVASRRRIQFDYALIASARVHCAPPIPRVDSNAHSRVWCVDPRYSGPGSRCVPCRLRLVVGCQGREGGAYGRLRISDCGVADMCCIFEFSVGSLCCY